MDSIDAGKGTMPDKSVVQSTRKATRYVKVCVAFVISTFFLFDRMGSLASSEKTERVRAVVRCWESRDLARVEGVA